MQTEDVMLFFFLLRKVSRFLALMWAFIIFAHGKKAEKVVFFSMISAKVCAGFARVKLLRSRSDNFARKSSLFMV